MEVETGTTVRTEYPSAVAAQESGLPTPPSLHAFEEQSLVEIGNVQSTNDDENPNGHTRLFIHDDNHSYDLWIHPNLSNRATVVAGIEVCPTVFYGLVILGPHKAWTDRPTVDTS